MAQHDEIITVVWVSYFSQTYLEKLYFNLRERASGRFLLRFLIMDNAEGKDDAIENFAAHRADVDIFVVPTHGLTGSRGHARGLDAAMPHLNTKYTLVCDPDIHVFKKDWDLFLVDLLESQGAVSAGVPYAMWRVGVYHHFPAPIFHFFKTAAIKSLDESWYPFARNKIRNGYNFLGRQVVRFGGLANRKNMIRSAALRYTTSIMERIFGVVGPDTGYLICQAADRASLGRVMFELVAAHHPSYAEWKNVPGFVNLTNTWEVYFFEGEPLLTHKYGTQSKMWRTDGAENAEQWFLEIEALERGLQEQD